MRIKNWSKFQHFKDRTPPWIKLHRCLLEQRDINMISDCSFRVLVGCWLLASEDETHQGRLPSVEDIAFRLRLSKSKIDNALQELKPFLLHDDITMISERYHVDAPEAEAETEGETKTEGEEEKDTRYGKRGHLLCFGEFQKVKLSEVEYNTLCEKHSRQLADRAIDTLDAWLARTGKRRKNHYACLKSDSWVWEKVGGSGTASETTLT